jgi:type IV pilus assembly protein PilN
MIKINLVSNAASMPAASPFASATPGAKDLFLAPEESRKEAFKRLVLLAVGPIALYIYQAQNLPAKEAALNSKNAVLAELQAYNAKSANSVAEIKKFKEDEALIEARISALEKVSKDRLKEIRIMELLQTVIPEKAWLTKVQIGASKLLIEGMALSDFEVSSFLESLTKSVFLVNVDLVNSAEVNQDGFTLKRFEISCALEKAP